MQPSPNLLTPRARAYLPRLGASRASRIAVSLWLTMALGCSTESAPLPPSNSADACAVSERSAPASTKTVARRPGKSKGLTLQAGTDGTAAYNNRISALIQTHCITCHSTATNTPPILDSYATVSAAQESITSTVASGTMPPSGGMAKVDKDAFAAWEKLGFPEDPLPPGSLPASAPGEAPTGVLFPATPLSPATPKPTAAPKSTTTKDKAEADAAPGCDAPTNPAR